MTDGTGTTQYSYVPVVSLGAPQLEQETGPLASSVIVSAYDELGRLKERIVTESGPEHFGHDAIGRLIQKENDLGTFALSYLGETDPRMRNCLRTCHGRSRKPTTAISNGTTADNNCRSPRSE